MFGIGTPVFIYSYKLDASAHYEWVNLCMPHSGRGSASESPGLFRRGLLDDLNRVGELPRFPLLHLGNES